MHSKGQVSSTPNTPLYINIRDRTKCSSNPIFPLSQRASSLPPSLPPWPIPAAVSVRPFNSRLPLFLSPLGSQHHRKSTKFLHFLTPLSFFFTVMNKLTLLLNSALWDPLPINMNTLCGCLLSHSIRCFPAPGAKATPLPRSFLRSSPACLSALLLRADEHLEPPPPPSPHGWAQQF